MDIEEFYQADERRRRSEEIEIGTDWHDGAGVRYEVSWVADTGELYVMGEPNAPVTVDLFGDIYELPVPTSAVTVAVVGWIADRARMEQVLDGWQAGHDRSPTASRGWPTACASSRCPASPRPDRPEPGRARRRPAPAANIAEKRNEFYSEEGP